MPTCDDGILMPDTAQSIRLIASDIDGTILPYAQAHTGAMSPRTISAFAQARAAGIEIVLVTGRPLRGVREISRVLGALGPVIASNGALTYDLAEDRVISSSPIATDIIGETLDLLRALDPTVSFGAETLDYVHMEPGFAEGSLWLEPRRRRAAGISDNLLRLGALEETLKLSGTAGEESTGTEQQAGAEVVKLLAKTHVGNPDEFIAAAEQAIGHLVTVTHSAPGVSLIEVSARGVTKASALQAHAQRISASAEQVIAFGDMPNDVEMLRWAGSSWAVDSGHPLAHAAADHRAPSCDDDGVAQIIEDLLPAHRGIPG